MFLYQFLCEQCTLHRLSQKTSVLDLTQPKWRLIWKRTWHHSITPSSETMKNLLQKCWNLAPIRISQTGSRRAWERSLKNRGCSVATHWNEARCMRAWLSTVKRTVYLVELCNARSQVFWLSIPGCVFRSKTNTKCGMACLDIISKNLGQNVVCHHNETTMSFS